MAFSTGFTPQEVCLFLKERVPGISEEVLQVLPSQNIDGEVFLELDNDNDYLHVIAPLLGDKVKLKKAIRIAKTSILSVRNKSLSYSTGWAET